MRLINNDLMKKLCVAHKFRDTNIVKILTLVTTSELDALFRHEDHPKYMECGDQFLRNFNNSFTRFNA